MHFILLTRFFPYTVVGQWTIGSLSDSSCDVWGSTVSSVSTCLNIDAGCSSWKFKRNALMLLWLIDLQWGWWCFKIPVGKSSLWFIGNIFICAILRHVNFNFAMYGEKILFRKNKFDFKDIVKIAKENSFHKTSKCNITITTIDSCQIFKERF